MPNRYEAGRRETKARPGGAERPLKTPAIGRLEPPERRGDSPAFRRRRQPLQNVASVDENASGERAAGARWPHGPNGSGAAGIVLEEPKGWPAGGKPCGGDRSSSRPVRRMGRGRETVPGCLAGCRAGWNRGARAGRHSGAPGTVRGRREPFGAGTTGSGSVAAGEPGATGSAGSGSGWAASSSSRKKESSDRPKS